jgi:hypothetical protein
LVLVLISVPDASSHIAWSVEHYHFDFFSLILTVLWSYRNIHHHTHGKLWCRAVSDTWKHARESQDGVRSFVRYSWVGIGSHHSLEEEGGPNLMHVG